MPEGRSAKPRGEFFVVDAPTFAKACDLGADWAAAYLVMACGTGRDSRTSTWSRDAISRHMGLTWRKARQKVDGLKAAGLVVELTPAGAPRPKFDLPPLERAPMPAAVARLAERIRNGLQPTSKVDRATATQGQALGWLARDGQGLWRFLEKPEGRAAFIPKSLIIRDDGQPSIVERLRQARDPKALQLLVDLYALQDLAERDGLAFRKTFTRESVQATSLHQLWRFRDEDKAQGEAGLAHHYAGKDGPAPFWRRIALLEDLGAIEWAYYLAEDGQPDAGLVYPVALVRNERVIEGALESVAGVWATLAAAVLHKGDDTEKFDDFADQAPFAFTLPVPRHMREAALVGVLRMRNRAWTTNTSRWRRIAQERAQEAVEGFRRIVEAESPATIRSVADCDPRRFTFSRPAEDPPVDWEERRRRLDAVIAEREARAASGPPTQPDDTLDDIFGGPADFNVSSTVLQRDINSHSDQVSHGAQRYPPAVEKPSASDFADLAAEMRRRQKPPSRRAQG
jgi:hypothetical protein